MRLLTALIELALVARTFSATRPIDLVIANKVISPDGFSSPRGAVLAGNSDMDLTFPGPLIFADKGDTFRINVQDKLNNASMLTDTSIHWHGFFQRGSSWADGPVGVTQCPIKSGNSFEYVFETGDQAGTFWYHSHYSTQYCDGLRGPMVVYDHEGDPHRELYEIDDESTIITLADWYHTVAPDIIGVGVPDATLINGKGRHFNETSNAPLAVIEVESDKLYRFRLVSLSCDPNYNFSIDGHNMTVIEADGISVKPVEVDHIQIFAGQRYSFTLNTTNHAETNYWVRANPNGPPNAIGFKGGINSAILRYKNATIEDPTTSESSPGTLLKETELQPISDPRAPGTPGRGNADVNINLNIGFNGTRFSVKGTTVPSIPMSDPNGDGSFAEDLTVPVLLHLLSGERSPDQLLKHGTFFSLPPNKVVEISIPGGSAGSPHPIHLHGHAFSVVHSAGSLDYNYENPVRRDVVSIGDSNDNVTIRFKTDNAGPWIMHCHIDWHLGMGLAVVFGEDIDTVGNSTNPPQAWKDLCPPFVPQTGL